MALNIFYTVLIYVSGMPVLLFVGLGSLFIIYWTDRFTFLRYYQRPYKHNYGMGLLAIKTLPWALVLHTLASMWVYSGPVWEPEPLPPQIDRANQVMDTIRLGHFSNFQSFFFLLVVAFLALYIVFEISCGSCAKHARLAKDRFMMIHPDMIANCNERTVEKAVEKLGEINFGSYDVTKLFRYQEAFLEFEPWVIHPEDLEAQEEKKRQEAMEERVRQKKEEEEELKNLKETREEKRKRLNEAKKKQMLEDLQKGEQLVEFAPQGYLQYVRVPCPKCGKEFIIADEGYEKEYSCPFCGRSSIM